MSLYGIIKTGKGKNVLFKLSRYNVNIFSTRSSFICEFNVQNIKIEDKCCQCGWSGTIVYPHKIRSNCVFLKHNCEWSNTRKTELYAPQNYKDHKI